MARTTEIIERLMWLWLTLLAVSAGQIAWWATDREQPFELLTYYAPPVHRGGVLHMTGEVRRNLDRGCSATFSRHLTDAQGFRVDLMTSQTMSAASIADMDRRDPQRLNLAIPIPDFVSPGQAIITTVMSYRCNPLHSIWPIQSDLRISFEVKP